MVLFMSCILDSSKAERQKVNRHLPSSQTQSMCFELAWLNLAFITPRPVGTTKITNANLLLPPLHSWVIHYSFQIAEYKGVGSEQKVTYLKLPIPAEDLHDRL